ncbi:MAG: aspartate/glutamate racemase family protein [Hoeflea sp.]|uniref:aspartate racemase/maleate isomerase family protein n=1 Tax=Hoeflea sp. TaxID=1940281 RepID=UPI001D571848|nr:aspartate/glutamate racemase family protein [Hoeflea sp.]MBU4531295.1 aspartate/glutamate racemase family protein [Alphaproteobacteria bacterium]MBU4544152.1 aspartate/glutamate racemase family protein [Alphaproteobacteria bacterium]MBU4550611.1 aspartate/glutamate racemase family protein [Alphaproteobacteria bacterium]MBV1724572.1 aspartate/glutamate racemase family protein [Hoeflea sp.]MBV1760592.1 aspartate/glutamate racemase family protein [Hoeflea sp.]
MSTDRVKLSGETVRFNDREATARFGLIALATDMTSERDLYRQLPEDHVAIHVTRVAFENPTTPDNLRKMTPRLTEAAALLEPLAPLKAICYSCTAASVVIGDAEVAAAIQQAVGPVPVVTPAGAARLAFAALGVKRLAILTPYTVATSQPMAAYFARHGMELVNFECLGLDDDRDMARVSDESIITAAIAADRPDAEALFLSCTGLPAINVIAEIERRLGKPVVTSNQASAWAMTRLGGFHDHRPAPYGRLFDCALPDRAFGEAA